MTSIRLQRLHDAGQSIWLDFIDRSLLRGELGRRISDDVLTGMTSNPTIFEKALAEGSAYDEQLRSAEDADAQALFELVATTDVRDACDAFREVYESTQGADGFVSIEVSPGAAHDTDTTLTEARRLWSTIGRPNVMIKVPGTDAGIAAVRRLIADGVNVNITLLFAVEAHRRVIDAYIAGLEERVEQGQPVDHVASVASFFVSRVDTEIDKRLAALGDTALQGRAAIANAKLAYRLFQREFSSPRWRALSSRGARVQRPLWASTSTKNPAYRDVIYVEELIGPDTVNTMPPQTLEAFRDHGETTRTVDRDVDAAERTVADLRKAGIPLEEVTDQLLVEGLASFQKSYDSLIAGLARKATALGKELVARG